MYERCEEYSGSFERQIRSVMTPGTFATAEDKNLPLNPSMPVYGLHSPRYIAVSCCCQQATFVHDVC